MPQNTDPFYFGLGLGALGMLTVVLLAFSVFCVLQGRRLVGFVLKFVSFNGSRANGEITLGGRFTEPVLNGAGKPGWLASLASAAPDLQDGVQRDQAREREQAS